jgi:hypothetical protein
MKRIKQILGVVLLNLVLTGCEDPLLSTKDDGVMKRSNWA